VFQTTAEKLAAIQPGLERSFLFGTAVRTAASARRRRARRREISDDELLEQPVDPAAGPDELAHLQRARELLDSILSRMDLKLSAVFVLFEIERMTMAEIAVLLDVPPGTVASRLRRARADFEHGVRRLEPKLRFRGGAP